MKIITFYVKKGGNGKTTFAALIGAGLAMKGYKVLLIDTDGQANLTAAMKIPKQRAFFNFVTESDKDSPDFVSTKDVIKTLSPEHHPQNLHIIPGNGRTQGIVNIMTLQDIINAMLYRFRQLAKVYDYVIIDTQPSPSTLHDAIAFITDYVICPTKPESFSVFDGLKETIEHLANIREQLLARGHDKAKLLGIIPNEYRSNTSLHATMLKAMIHGARNAEGQLILDKNKNPLFEGAGDLVWDPFPLRVNLAEAQLKKTTIMQDAPDLEVNQLIWNLVNRVERETNEVNHA